MVQSLRVLTLVVCTGVCLPPQHTRQVPPAPDWGFWAHREVNRQAVFVLPLPMRGFYKRNIDYLTAQAIRPDQRRYAVPGEAPRHYIDLDVLVGGVVDSLPRAWEAALLKFGPDSLHRHGQLPWHILRELRRLEEAFYAHNAQQILSASAELGHYLADAHVPLHTTANYDGQRTGHPGAHSLWETALPERYHPQYRLYSRPAQYWQRPSDLVWAILAQAHAQVDTLLAAYTQAERQLGGAPLRSFQPRGTGVARGFSPAFLAAYHAQVGPQVARQLQLSITHLADLWYTAWVNAGQPSLDSLGATPLWLPDSLAQAPVGYEGCTERQGH
ncbi:MAG: zinc dependent phospholipase C family protein [Bacteroidia bacterium]|nr:zinc dependent phospholipase C family protein [Bacteroidia bacterium]